MTGSKSGAISAVDAATEPTRPRVVREITDARLTGVTDLCAAGGDAGLEPPSARAAAAAAAAAAAEEEEEEVEEERGILGPAVPPSGRRRTASRVLRDSERQEMQQAT